MRWPWMTPCGCRSSARSRCATDDRVTPVAGVKLQSLLALLALAAPHAVSDDRLIEELWGDEQPANPANALQALVSHLRRLLGRDVVARQGPGYALRVDPDLIDASRLERLVQRGPRRRRRAATTAWPSSTFRAARRPRAGPPLGDLADSLVRPRRRRPPRRAGARRPRGPHRRRADDGPARRRARRPRRPRRPHPLRERFRAQLIIALYRSGRQADALQAYRDARAPPPRRARPRSRARSCRASSGPCWPTTRRSRHRSR